MKITFNEAARMHKVASIEEAAAIYQQFLDTYMALEQDCRITNKVDFVGKVGDISTPVTIGGNTVYELQKMWGNLGRTKISKLLAIFNSFASTKRTPMPSKNFTVDGITFLIPEDDSNAMLISLETLPKYGAPFIDGKENDDSILCMKNIANTSQIEKDHRLALGIRLYERNPKHKLVYSAMGDGNLASPMDLVDTAAQELLNRAIAFDAEKVLYAAKGGKCYAFREHEPGKAIYHGYLVDNPSPKVKNALGLK